MRSEAHMEAVGAKRLRGRDAGFPALAAAMGLAAAWGSGALAQQPSTPAVDPSLLAYASTKDSVRLPDGRTLHLVCMGHGSPVVILSAGAGGWSTDWNKVQPQVARKTRVCAWDRPGFGFSSPSPTPQTVGDTTTDLQAALKAGGVAAPYVAVGHSLGGFESLLLKDREPSKVVGMVLVDPSFPDQIAVFDRVAPVYSKWNRAEPPPVISFLEKCVAALRAGEVRRGGPDPDGCLRPQPRPASYPPELRAALDRRFAQATPATIATTMEAFVSTTTILVERNSKIAVKPDRDYGRMPLIVLTAGDRPPPPGLPDAAKPEMPSYQAEIVRRHEALAALSTQGVDRLVPGSTHYIQQIRPQVVIDAIDEVVDKARGSDRRNAAR